MFGAAKLSRTTNVWHLPQYPGTDGIYAEYTFNGDKQELYEDVYKKLTNTCHTEE